MAFRLKFWPFEASASGKTSDSLLTGFGLAGIVGFLFGSYKYATSSENSGKYLGLAGLGASLAYGSFVYAENKEEQQEKKNTQKQKEAEAEMKDVNTESSPTDYEFCRIDEATFDDIVYSVPTTDFKPLVGDLVSSGGIYVLVAPTGTGKSILATQMGIDIATGISSKCVPGDVNKAPQKVIYYNGELKAQDWANRYGKNGVSFPKETFLLVSGKFQSFMDFLSHVKDKGNEQDSDCTIIIDNLTTYAGQEITAKIIIDLFHTLENIQHNATVSGRNVTIILVAHANKDYDDKKRLELKDIAGSSTLAKFATGIFGLSNTDEDDSKILYELKRRREGIKKELRLKRVDYPYVHFELSDDEQDLSDVSDEDLQNVQSQQQSNCGSANTQQVDPDIAKMMDLRNAGKTDDEIAADMNCSRQTVYRKIGAKNPKTKK